MNLLWSEFGRILPHEVSINRRSLSAQYEPRRLDELLGELALLPHLFSAYARYKR